MVKKKRSAKGKPGSKDSETLDATLIALMQNIHNYSGLLSIEKTRIEDELEAQAGYYWNVTSLAAAAKNLVDSYEDKLKQILHTTDEARRELTKGAKEPSEARLDKHIRGSSRYLKCQKDLRECKRVYEKAERLVQAWNQRQFMLTKLADYEISRMYHEHDYSAGTRKTRDRISEATTKRVKKKRSKR